MAENFEHMLSGGHPNSLGRTVEVVEQVLKNPAKFEELYHCYFSTDEVVRLRVSNAMKRVAREHPDWLVPYIDRFLGEIAAINQVSTQWTLATLFLWLDDDMTPSQKERATTHLKKNLETNEDWIVQNTTIETLSQWAKDDEALRTWLVPHLEAFAKSSRKSVAGRATKMLKMLHQNSK